MAPRLLIRPLRAPFRSHSSRLDPKRPQNTPAPSTSSSQYDNTPFMLHPEEEASQSVESFLSPSSSASSSQSSPPPPPDTSPSEEQDGASSSSSPPLIPSLSLAPSHQSPEDQINPRLLNPFNTHAYYKRLEKDFSPPIAHALMRATRGILIHKLLKAQSQHVDVLEGENVSVVTSLLLRDLGRGNSSFHNVSPIQFSYSNGICTKPRYLSHELSSPWELGMVRLLCRPQSLESRRK